MLTSEKFCQIHVKSECDVHHAWRLPIDAVRGWKESRVPAMLRQAHITLSESRFSVVTKTIKGKTENQADFVPSTSPNVYAAFLNVTRLTSVSGWPNCQLLLAKKLTIFLWQGLVAVP